MSARFTLKTAAPGGYQAMVALHAQVKSSGLDHALVELVKVRVSQLNGCAYCVALHVDEAKKAGVSETRLHLLAVWREAPVYSDAERAALAWAETLTLLPGRDVPNEAFAAVRAAFTVEQVAELSVAIVEINAWNRLMMAARMPPELSGAS